MLSFRLSIALFPQQEYDEYQSMLPVCPCPVKSEQEEATIAYRGQSDVAYPVAIQPGTVTYTRDDNEGAEAQTRSTRRQWQQNVS